MPDPKLRECPFCLGDDVELLTGCVHCHGCGTEGPVHSDPHMAEHWWNTRPTPSDPKGDKEQC